MAKRKRFSLNMAYIYLDSFLFLIGAMLAVFGVITIATDASRSTAGWIALVGGLAFAFFTAPNLWNHLGEGDR